MKKPAPLQFPKPSDRFAFERTFEVISPVFGGGVRLRGDGERHIKDLDPLTPIRGTAIRGQLRFWWRAIHGCTEPSIEAMRQREEEIFGGVTGSEPRRSPVVVQVLAAPTAPTNVEDVDVFKLDNGRPRPRDGMAEIAYGAFPLRPDENHRDPGVLHRIRGPITIRVTGPTTHEGPVTDAVDAWLVFGGLGGRTRRGFGAIAQRGGADPKQLLDRLQGSMRTTTLPGVPTLRGAHLEIANQRFLSADPVGGDRALAFGLGALQRLRQGVGVGRNPGEDRRQGRSRWPEAETIRELTGRSHPRHRERLVGVDAFPRAAFGLPIIFAFQDERTRREPEDTTLRPAEADRFASPLFLRPYRVAEGVFGALALVLETSIPALQLRGPGGPWTNLRGRVSREEARRITPLEGHQDPLAAFLRLYRQFRSSP
ncbi:MAG: type III-B CRISPR module RAMP protein Cmr1 [Deltaproteobacteria bacterium]|nr:type III-B CRISPR module RAMP protein Cmr1 [Deltaproteobacteria bacterium]